MAKKKRNPLTYICSDLLPGIEYRFSHLVDIGISYGYTYDEVVKSLLAEIQKKSPKIILGFDKNAFLNPKHKNNKKVVEPVKTETETIAETVIQKNKEFIQKWIETEFDKKLEVAVQKFVVSEFKEEILPVLIKHIDEKVENIEKSHDKSVRAHVIEFLTDALLGLAHKEISK